MPEENVNIDKYYAMLSLRCNCGELHKGKINHVGLFADHRIVIAFKCRACRTMVHMTMAISDLWRSCPTREALAKLTAKEEAVAPAKFIPKDGDFLHSLGAKLPDQDTDGSEANAT